MPDLRGRTSSDVRKIQQLINLVATQVSAQPQAVIYRSYSFWNCHLGTQLRGVICTTYFETLILLDAQMEEERSHGLCRNETNREIIYLFSGLLFLLSKDCL